MSRLIYAKVVLFTYPIAIFTAFMAAFMGFLFAIPGGLNLDSSALGQMLPGEVLDHLWAAIYFAGGVMTLYGFFGRKPRHEAAGLVLLGFGLGVQAYAVLIVRGIEPGLVAGSCLCGTSLGCFFRSYVIMTARAPWLVTNAPG